VYYLFFNEPVHVLFKTVGEARVMGKKMITSLVHPKSAFARFGPQLLGVSLVLGAVDEQEGAGRLCEGREGVRVVENVAHGRVGLE
jgi:hypothetical protein